MLLHHFTSGALEVTLCWSCQPQAGIPERPPQTGWTGSCQLVPHAAERFLEAGVEDANPSKYLLPDAWYKALGVAKGAGKARTRMPSMGWPAAL